jgi:tripartite-type tricarboxylate transporter receptor subunit TctC
MTFTKRVLSACILALGIGTLGMTSASAQSDYPNRPVRLVVPFAPGGVTDTSARIIAEQMSKRLGQQVIVDNRPGASGNIGTSQVARADADGYTLLLGFDGTMVINPHVFANIPFDTLKDFAPVGKIGDAILIIVAHPSLAANNLNEVIALSKKTPGGLSYGTSGAGSTPHIMGETINVNNNSNLVHIAYKGGGPAMIDLQGGNIPLVITAVAGALPHIKANRIKAIGVSSASRASSLPDLPTFIEQGQKDFVLNSWVGILAPQKTPSAIITKLNAALNESLRDPEVAKRLESLGVTPMPDTPAQFGASMKRDLELYAKVVKAAKLEKK